MNRGVVRPRRWLAVAATAALSIIGGCDRAVDAAGAARETIDRLDLEAVGERAPEMLRELGARTAEELRTAVERLPDEEGLRRLASEWAPTFEKLGRLRERLGGALPGRATLEAVLAALSDLIAGNEDLRDAAEPLIEGLEQLLR